jgi:hypothetical protein
VVEQTPGLAQIEATLIELVAGLETGRGSGRGRPLILPAALLWASLTIGVLRGVMSQAAVWRLVRDRELWRGRQVAVSDEAVYKRLAAPGPSPLATVFPALTRHLATRVAPWADQSLAPFAAAVVAIDQTTLDPVARRLPALRSVPRGDHTLLPGQLAGVFDIRSRLWTRLDFIGDPHQNEKRAARSLLADLPGGSLILADLGYFSFRWFDELTEAGHYWISRVPAKVSMTVVHTLVARDAYREELVFLGRHRADRSKHLARVVQFTTTRGTHTYLTNVCDPAVLPVREVAGLYARRWDIELAVKLVKRELGLGLLWSAKPAVIMHQLWAVLLIAQIWQALRVEIAGRAGVAIDDVSLPLLVSELPRYAAGYPDPLAAFIADGRLLGYIRPSRRLVPQVPRVPLTAFQPPPLTLPTTQRPRYSPWHRSDPARQPRRTK